MISLHSSLAELVESIRVKDPQAKTLGYHAGIRGTACYFEAPSKSEYTLEDIVVTLSRTPRWGARTKLPWSVLEHTTLVVHILQKTGASDYEIKCGLLHDASEAVLGDCPSPLKARLTDYRRLERIWCVDIGLRAGLGLALSDLPLAVKRADILALEVERHALMENREESWALWGSRELSPELVKIVSIVRETAELSPSAEAVARVTMPYFRRHFPGWAS